MKKRLVSLALALSLMGVFTLGASAQPQQTTRNGAAGLVAAVVAALNNVNVDVDNIDVAVVELNNSLNNLRALNNVLNNSPILSNNNVTIGDINILNDAQLEVLSDIGINVEDVLVIIEVLDGGDFVAIVLPQ